MKGRIVAVTIALVMSISAITANVRWSEAQQGAMPAGEARQAVDQATPVMPGAEETSVPVGDFNSSPVMFIENAGQWDDGARFQVWGGAGGTMWLAQDAIWITVLEPEEASEQADLVLDPRLSWQSEDREDSAPRRGVNIKLSFVGANPQPRIETFDRLDTVVSYFYGNDPDQWRPDVPVWGGVRYVDLYPGIDLELTNQDGQMTPKLAARPGANLDSVLLHVVGADAIAVDEDVLRLSAPVGEFTLPLLRADGLQIADSKVEPSGAQAFDVAAPLVPANSNRQSAIENRRSAADNPADLLYGTFLGGGGEDHGSGIAVDGAGSAYVTGDTYSGNFPTTPGAFDTSHNGYYDAFVVKLNSAGSALAYATFLGGNCFEGGYAIAVNGTGSAFVTGYTYCGDFPTTPGAFDTSHNGGNDAFVAKLNATGSALVYATFLGGSGNDDGYAIAVDAADSAHVTGDTYSGNFPTTLGAFDTSHNGYYDTFVAKLNATGSVLTYATYLGGSGDNFGDHGYAIAVDGTGSAYVAGRTDSSNFPVTQGAFDTSYNGNHDAFVVKLHPAGSALAYATFLGGSREDYGYAIAVDGAGSAYVTGETWPGNFPTTPGAFDTSPNGGNFDAFVAKLNPAGSALAYATFLGGSGYEGGSAIAMDGAGGAYVTGYTYSANFPTTPGAFATSQNAGNYDAFVAHLNPAGSLLTYATFLGGSDFENGEAIAVDEAGSAYVTGATVSSDFPTTPGTFDPDLNGNNDAFVAKLAALGTGGTLSLSGYVRDQANHSLPGVMINAGSAGSVVTDSNGAFVVPNLASGLYTLTPNRNGYGFTPTQRTVLVNSNVTGQDFRGVVDGGTPNPFLDLPFDYGGLEANYRQALKNWNNEGRINSWFDHKYPDYTTGYGIWLYKGEPYTQNFQSMSGVPCYTGYCYDGHNGIDFGYKDPDPNQPGSQPWPILAAAAGVVKVTEISNSGYGNNVIVFHEVSQAPGYFTRYAHLESINVSVNTSLSLHDQVGIAGNSGNGGGSHLHFGVYRDDGDGIWEPSQDKAVDAFGWQRRNVTDPWVADRQGTPSHRLWLYNPDQEVVPVPGQPTVIMDLAGNTHLVIPIDAFLGQARLLYSPGPVAGQSANLHSSGYSFWLDLLEWFGGGQNLTEFTSTAPITITVAYSDTDILHLDESRLAFQRWDEELATWHPLSTTVDVLQNRVTAQTQDLGGFDLQAPLLCATDVFEPDDGYQAARVVWPNDWPLARGLDIPNDSDWITLQATPGVAYIIRTQNLAGGADTVVNLYDTDVVTLLASDDNTGGGLASEIRWTAPYSGTFFIETLSASGGVTSCAAVYQLTIGTIPGDVIADCQVNVADLQAVAERWQLSEANPDPDANPDTPNYETRFDLDRDGVITIADIMHVAAAWGTACE